ncbi:hypothetical protein ES703_14848 [subsurface metagenome]
MKLNPEEGAGDSADAAYQAQLHGARAEGCDVDGLVLLGEADGELGDQVPGDVDLEGPVLPPQEVDALAGHGLKHDPTVTV